MARLGEFRILALPRTYSTTGGSQICSRDWRYSGSVQFTSLQPTRRGIQFLFCPPEVLFLENRLGHRSRQVAPFQMCFAASPGAHKGCSAPIAPAPVFSLFFRSRLAPDQGVSTVRAAVFRLFVLLVVSFELLA